MLFLIGLFTFDATINGRWIVTVEVPLEPPVEAPADLPQSLVDFMGGHGCTFTPARDVATRDAGFDPYEVNRLIETSLANGTARDEGGYIVLGREICTIRLPDIQSDFAATDPFIRRATTDFDHFHELYKDDALYDGEDLFGCFLQNPLGAFDVRAGGEPGAGFDDYIAYMAAGIIAGDVRFYSPSPLQTPFSSQIMAGPGCDTVPNAAFVAASHPYLLSGFGEFVRQIGEGTSCNDGREYINPMLIAVEIQGADLTPDAPEDPNINAWLGAEWDIITRAAGWHEGMTGSQRGEPRPPLCHYSD